jgi:replication factor A3
MAAITPRITAQYLETFQDRVVRIVGKVTQLRGTQVTIDSNGPVVLRFTGVRAPLPTKIGKADTPQKDVKAPMNHHIEVIGKVLQGDLAVKVLFCSDFGANFGPPPFFSAMTSA